jgi:hypothetical protein
MLRWWDFDMKPVVSPTYIYLSNTTDSHYFAYFKNKNILHLK